MPEFVFGSYRFTPGPLMTAVAVAFIALTVGLGSWQTGRAEQKLQMQARLEKLVAEPPLALPRDLVDGEALVQRRIAAKGRFEGMSFFADNKVYRGVPGYHVLTPFCGDAGQPCVLVNRGWIAAGPRRDVLPVIERTDGIVELEGMATLPPQHPYELGVPDGEGAVIQHLVVERLAARSKLVLQPFILLQTNVVKDTLVRDWPRPDTGVNTHRAYALQWYVMALVGLVLWIKLNLHPKVEENDDVS